MSFFQAIKRKIRAVFSLNRNRQEIKDTYTYWVNRSRSLGPLAVLNVGHDVEEIDKVTEFQVQEIFPYLNNIITGNENLVLDFGCGTGRFSAKLSELIDGKVVAVDPIQELINLAKPHPHVEYLVSRNNKLPIEDEKVDILWICLVLGGIKEKDIKSILPELDRVCKPGAIICLVENTINKSDAPHWYFRSPEWYSNKLYFADLNKVGSYCDLEEEISIMIGRKNK